MTERQVLPVKSLVWDISLDLAVRTGLNTTIEELNELFGENWSKFLTAWYLVF